MLQEEIAKRLSVLLDIKALGIEKRLALAFQSTMCPLSEDLSKLDDMLFDLEVGNVEMRKVYLFACIFVFSPHKYAGYKMKRQLMRELVRRLKISVSLISHSAENADFYFLHYDDFAREATKVVNRALV